MKQVNQKLQIYREFYTNSAVAAVGTGIFAPAFSGQSYGYRIISFFVGVILSYTLLKLAELYAE